MSGGVTAVRDQLFRKYGLTALTSEDDLLATIDRFLVADGMGYANMNLLWTELETHCTMVEDTDPTPTGGRYHVLKSASGVYFIFGPDTDDSLNVAADEQLFKDFKELNKLWYDWFVS